MKVNKVIVTGASGFIGKKLCDFLIGQGLEVHGLFRSIPKNINAQLKVFLWNPEERKIDLEVFDGVNGIIHLAGAPVVDKAWSTDRKKILRDSRVEALEFLMKECPDRSKIKSLVSASGIAYYGTLLSKEVFTEDKEPAKHDFLQRLTEEWERCVVDQDIPHYNMIRTPLVLHPDGGFLKKIKPLVGLSLASNLGSGKQWVSWIHMNDLLRIYFHAIQGRYDKGAINAVAPDNRTFKDFLKSICDHYGKVMFPVPVPSFMLKLILGERAGLLTKGVFIKSNVLTPQDFEFNLLEKALGSFPNK